MWFKVLANVTDFPPVGEFVHASQVPTGEADRLVKLGALEPLPDVAIRPETDADAAPDGDVIDVARIIADNERLADELAAVNVANQNLMAENDRLAAENELLRDEVLRVLSAPPSAAPQRER